jgi:vitamin B12 transporter
MNQKPNLASLVGILAAFAFTTTYSHAQNRQLSDVVVTATRMPQKVNDTLSDVVVIGREQIENAGHSSITELLSAQPGLQSVTYGGNSIFIRGAEARMTAVYIDGIRVDSQEGAIRLGGGAPWELIPMEAVERIEIVKGPISSVYGSDPMGGVIQIFTRQSQEGTYKYVNAGTGSYRTSKFSTGLGGQNGSIDYAFSVMHDETAGFNTVPSVQHTPDREPYRNTAVNGRLGLTLNRQHKIETVFLSNQLDNRFVDMYGAQPTVDFASKSKLDTGALRWIAQWSDAYTSKLSTSYSNHDVKDNWNDFVTTMQGVTFENQWSLAAGTMVVTYDHKADKFSDRNTGGFVGERAQNALSAGYGLKSGSHAYQLNIRSDHDSLFGGKNTAGLAYGFDLTSAWKLTASVSSGFRSPTLEQTYSTYGSRDIQPETSRNHDVSLRYVQGATKYGLVIFRNDFHNLISARPAPDFTYYNIGQATTQGITLSGQRKLGSYNFRSSLDILDAKDGLGRELPLRAKQKGLIGLDRSFGKWSGGGELHLISKRFDNAANTVELGGYSLLNLFASYQIASDLSAHIKLNNLANKQYEQVSMFASPGRTLFAALRWQSRD